MEVIMENASTYEKKEDPKLYLTERERKMAKDLMECFEGTSNSRNFSAKHWGRIKRMLY